MGGPHGHTLHFHGHSLLHRAPAHVKVVATLGFVLAVVGTPREAVWAFAVHLALLVGVAVVSTVPPRYLILPAFGLLFAIGAVLLGLSTRALLAVAAALAVTMPFIATGPTVPVGPLELSQAGLWAGWGLFAKGSLGALAAVLLAATTEAGDLVSGLARLRVPRQLVLVLSFMIRYLDVVSGEMRRMRVARESRGFRTGGLRSWPVLGSTAGALFVRSYERGERVHLAMLSRGFQGRVDLDDGVAVRATTWSAALVVPAAAVVVATTAWALTGGGVR